MAQDLRAKHGEKLSAKQLAMQQQNDDRKKQQ
jgi:hypothetical protein